MQDKIIISTKEFEENRAITDQYFTNKKLIDFKQSLQHLDSESVESQELYKQAISVIGSETYYNESDNYKIAKSYKGIKLEFNPNKLMKKAIGSDNILTFNELNDCVDMIEQEISEIGIDCKLKEQRIYRYDTNFDIITPKQYYHYIPILKMVLPNTPVKKFRKFTHESTLYLQNSNKVIACYDKTKESELDFNCMRLEVRNLKIVKEQRYSLKSMSESKYWQIRAKDKSLIEQQLFNQPNFIMNESDNDTNDTIALLIELLRKHRMTIPLLNKTIATQSIETALNHLDITLSQLVSEINYKSPNYKLLKKVESQLRDYKVLSFELQQDFETLTKLFLEVA